MKRTILIYWLCASSGWSAPRLWGQGTLVYDQQSSSDEATPVGGSPIQFYGMVGQSFTPSLTTVGFIRIKVYDIVPGNALGATLVMNLRTDTITGPIIGTASPIILADGFAGSVNFFFGSAIPVIPSVTYFFETSVQSGDSWGIRNRSDSQGDANYLGGVFYGGSQPFSGADLWFREGIIVPEPAAVALLVCGCVVWFGHRNRLVRM